MKRKLYANMKRITTIFSICIIGITVLLLVLRLSVFSDMAVAPETNIESVSGDLLNYSLNSQVYFSSPTAKGNVLIENKSTDGYISVAIQDPDTKDDLLYTGLIEPGKGVKTSRLSQELEEGVYRCRAEITAYDADTREPLGKEEREILLFIGELPDPVEE